MTILRVRVEVADRAGQLARLAAAVADLGGNIVGLDVHLGDGARVADELVVEFAHAQSATELATTGSERDGVVLDVEPIDEHGLVDPVVHALVAACRLLPPDPGGGALAAATRALLRADGVCLLPARGAPPSAALSRALRQRAPVVATEWLLSEPVTGEAPPSVLVVPDGGRLLVATRARPAFSTSEVARAVALLRLDRRLRADAAGRAEWARAALPPAGPVRRRRSFLATGTPAGRRLLAAGSPN